MKVVNCLAVVLQIRHLFRFCFTVVTANAPEDPGLAHSFSTKHESKLSSSPFAKRAIFCCCFTVVTANLSEEPALVHSFSSNLHLHKGRITLHSCMKAHPIAYYLSRNALRILYYYLHLHGQNYSIYIPAWKHIL